MDRRNFDGKKGTALISDILLETNRLILRTPLEKDAEEFQKYEERNMPRLAPWRGTAPGPEDDHRTQILKWRQELQENKSVRFLLFLKDRAEYEIIGLCHFSHIFRGPFQACYLGYQIDGRYEGKGLMSEGLRRAIAYMSEEKNIHRIMANYMPENKRSAALLDRLGFTIEGRAQNYLLINGRWEDHILTSLTNHSWRA